MLILLVVFLVSALLTPGAAAQDGDGTIRIPYIGPDGAEERPEDAPPLVEVDGTVAPEEWREAVHRQVALARLGDSMGDRYGHLYLQHNGTTLFLALVLDEAQTVTVQFDPTPGATAGGRHADALRLGDGGVEDLHWDVEAGDWRPDTDGEGCDLVATGARGDADGRATYEIARPLEGDGCDALLREDFALRLETAGGDGETRIWPAGSTARHDDQGRERTEATERPFTGWAGARLEARFGGDGDDVGQDPGDAPIDQDRRTAEEGEVDTDRPIAGHQDGREDAYDPGADGQDTPAPGWAMIVFVAVAGLALVAASRRR